MIDMKCPVCNSNLITTRLCDGILPNPNKGKIDEIFCDKCKMRGTKEIWEALINERQHATDCQDLFIEAIAQKLEIETENKDLSDKIGKLETELDRTRKALDVAVDALNTIKGKHDPRCAVYHIDEKTAYDALEKITALEQKD